MSDAALFNPLSSAQWHRVAALRPRLAEQVEASRQWVRGQRWHVLSHPVSGQSCRLNAAAYAVAARLDGRISLQDLWALLDTHTAAEQEPPSQDDVLAVIQQLHRHQLLSFDEAPDFGALHAPVGSRAAGSPDEPTQAVPDTSPAHKPPNTLLAWRLPLLNPERALRRCHGLALRVYAPLGLLLWSVLVLSMLAATLAQWPALQAHALKWMSTPRYLLLATLSYPLMKAIHEAAHALAVQRWGGRVREAGIALMMFMPVPYVDASASHGFALAWQRALVSAAGIMAELALAALGLWAWHAWDSGWPHELGFVVWFVGCVSTVLFNANPLQKLDGYHVLSDALQLPNLAVRSRQWWQDRAQRWLQGPTDAHRVSSAPTLEGERPWLMAYAPLAWLYQLLLWCGITWWMGHVSSLLGWAAAALTCWLSLVMPARQGWRLAWQALMWAGPHQRAVRWRAAFLLMLPLLLCLPWPERVLVQGVVWAPDEALVRPQTEGIVDQVLAADGSTVQAGDVLLTLHNPKLLAERERIASELAQAEQASFGAMSTDLGKAGQADDQVQRWQAELARVDERIAALQVHAHHAGRLVLPHAADLPGRYLHRGDTLGHILNGAGTTVRVAVQDQDAARLRERTRAVSVSGHQAQTTGLEATLQRDSLGATHQLPSAALSTDMGGPIQTDPQDEHHTKALRPIVVMDVTLDGPATSVLDHERLGERMWVRFDEGWSLLPLQAWRWLQQRALSDFSAQH